MKIVNVGLNYRHPDNFVINRPFGSGDCIFLLFKTPAFIELYGERFDIEPDSVIIFDKGTPQHYGAKGCEFCNDWIHFEIDEKEHEEIASLGIPFDTVFPAYNASVLTEYLKSMFVERYSENRYREETLSLIFRLILLKLSEALDTESASVERPYYERLQRLRSEIFDSPEKERTIESISRDIRLSRSYMQHLYKKYFGVSLSSDIKSSRMEYAKHLLSGTKMTVLEVSRACGYNSDVHFMRQFKGVTGQTPTEYRNGTAVLSKVVDESRKGNPFCL